MTRGATSHELRGAAGASICRRHLALVLWPFAALPATATSFAHSDPTGVHAIVGARIVSAPGSDVARGTVVVRDGLIAAVGQDVQPPADARIWDGSGLTVYPGLVDPYLEAEQPGGSEARPEVPPSGPPAARQRPRADPARPTGAGHRLDALRPERRIADGPPPSEERLAGLRRAGFTVAQLVGADGVLRGWSATLALGDGRLNDSLLRADSATVIAMERTRDGYPGSTMGAVAAVRQALLDARWYAAAHDAYRSSPRGSRRPETNRAWAALQPVISGTRPALFVAQDMLALLRAAAVTREASLAAYALAADDAYKRASAVAATGLALVVPVAFPDPPRLEVSGAEADVATEELRHWQRAAENPGLLERAGVRFALTSHGLDDPGEFRARVARAIARGLSADRALAAATSVPAELLGLLDRLGTLEAGKIANLTVVRGELFSREGEVESVWIDGRRYAPPEKTGERPEPEGPEQPDSAEAAQAPSDPVPVPRVAGDPEAWRAAAPEQPALLLVRGATIWTSGPRGRLEGADLLVRAGRIAEVGIGIDAPAGTVVIDAAGKHVVPGIVDAHSHAAISGGGNECTNSVTAEVRVGDVVNSESIHIYRLLAGGTTAQQLLHGSCNAIGGQSALIKNRWGAAPAGLLFEGAPATIKFALGENPKRAGGPDRYPRSRAGVEQVIREAFVRARDYRAAWQEWEGGRLPLPPRRDLQLDAVAEVLSGERAIHAHSYRQSEILMLMRLAEEFGVEVAVFQHILEGYKVADEMAAHGAAASGFSDWWGYKFEVYDAIPYNGYLMWDRGVLVSFNSDSAELARRLNTEAAKAVKYGGVPEQEALRFVTLNPARQLGVDDRVGSLETGKDADFAIWSASPLSTYAIVEQTWVDGRRYFDRAADLAGRGPLVEERAALLEAARAAAAQRKEPKPRGGRRPAFAYLESTDMSDSACGHDHGLIR